MFYIHGHAQTHVFKCACKKLLHAVFFFSGDEAVMNTNAPKAEGLEEVKSAAGSDVRNLKSKVSIVCFMYKMPHYKQIELKTRFYNLLRLIQ